ncbi:MAG: zinc ribbon domain-containing protein [Bacteroidota bacterium]
MNAFKCPKCGKLTGGNEKFCVDCGQPLNITCPECGETWRFMFEYKFCPGCGHHMKNVVTHEENPDFHSNPTPKPKAKK